MNWKCYLGCIGIFAFGCLMGATTNNNKYLAGRMAACKDLVQVLMADPLLAIGSGGVTCEEQNNEVYIRTNNQPDKLWKLNGQPK